MIETKTMKINLFYSLAILWFRLIILIIIAALIIALGFLIFELFLYLSLFLAIVMMIAFSITIISIFLLAHKTINEVGHV